MEENDETEENDMNEWERLHKQAERYRVEYPPGTRIMLLSMSSDPRPVENNTKGTVKAVDDIGTLHCTFDNGRSLGLIPEQDSFRRLTSKEIAEEQNETVKESVAPLMGM